MNIEGKEEKASLSLDPFTNRIIPQRNFNRESARKEYALWVSEMTDDNHNNINIFVAS